MPAIISSDYNVKRRQSSMIIIVIDYKRQRLKLTEIIWVIIIVSDLIIIVIVSKYNCQQSVESLFQCVINILLRENYIIRRGSSFEILLVNVEDWLQKEYFILFILLSLNKVLFRKCTFLKFQHWVSWQAWLPLGRKKSFLFDLCYCN